MSDPTEEEIAKACEAILPYCKQVNDTPALMSILYDIGLMPEQITRMVNAARMVAFCEVFKRLTPEQTATLFEPPKPKKGRSK